MKSEERIITESQRLFDAAGIVPDGEDSILILGLATTTERDLDDFFRDKDGALQIRGFETHVQPRLDSLVSFLREKGLSAEILGQGGYPLRGELNLKQLHDPLNNEFKDTYDKAKQNIEALRMRSGHGTENDVHLALNGLYGYLMLKLKKKEISKETAEAFASISEWVGRLAEEYKMANS